MNHNPQHEVYERLKKAIKEKHGPWPEEAERLFKRLRLLHKDKTDSEIWQMVKEEVNYRPLK